MNHQPEATLRLDSSTEPRPVPAADTSALPEGWISLPDCLLEPRPVEGPATTILVPMALLHPEFGVALLGVPGAVAEAAAAAFRQRLEDARFPAIFPGHLPVVTLAMLPGEPLNLRRRLAAAFAAVPPLDLAGGDGWITLVSRLLQTRPLVRPPTLSPRRQRPEAPRPTEPAKPSLPNLPWRTLGPMLGLAGGGLVIGLLLGINHQPAAPPQSGAEVAPRPVASAPPPPRAEAPAPQPQPQRQALQQPPPPVASAPAPAPASPALAPVIARPPADPAPGPSLPRVLVRSAANLRAGPDSSTPILRIAARGEAFRVHGEARGGWIQVGGAAPEGWIHSSLLTEP
jgi:hypothetical protein